MMEVDIVPTENYEKPFSMGQIAYCIVRRRDVIQIFTNLTTRHPMVRISIGHELGHKFLEKFFGLSGERRKIGEHEYAKVGGKWVKDDRRIIYWVIEIICYLFSFIGFLPIFKFNKL